MAATETDAETAEPDAELEANLAASAVSGQTPPAGPQWLRGLAPLAPSARAFDDAAKYPKG